MSLHISYFPAQCCHHHATSKTLASTLSATPFAAELSPAFTRHRIKWAEGRAVPVSGYIFVPETQGHAQNGPTYMLPPCLAHVSPAAHP